ncbi:MAG: hypothetical protein LKG90_07065 [Lachnospiraceae bacterium]|jgi:hypothetical protein|nr:hypothetical protein [Lachnospiraceae bacterium]MCH4028494.1 hypothetical protein [Lachnospiraceae bacterium]MCH4066344.1 hypothetical protein [Lachnospiraceae bacterium]MCH4112374.1 hypothetical protein [Lachnospiraceae bacterium]MCI1353656.1 hypothetical protein [Lachnospiraceae bacterium]
MAFEISSIAGSVSQSAEAAARVRAAQFSERIPDDSTQAAAVADTNKPVVNGLTGDTYIRTYVRNNEMEDTASHFPGTRQNRSYQDTKTKALSDDSEEWEFRMPGAGNDEDTDTYSDARLFGRSDSTFNAILKADGGKNASIGAQEDTNKKPSVGAQEDTNKKQDKAGATDGSKTVTKVSELSASERAALIRSIRIKQAEQQQQFLRMIRSTFGTQAAAAGSSDPIRRSELFSGGLSANAVTQAAAQTAVSEDGVYGVSQTSNRLFQIAVSMSGGNPAVMRSLQNAILAGYSQAASDWGTDLPGICAETLKATNQLFSSYYSSSSDTAAADETDSGAASSVSSSSAE